jgi:hypothetical protein
MQPTEAQLRQLYHLISIKSENYARVGSEWEGMGAIPFSTPNYQLTMFKSFDRRRQSIVNSLLANFI